MPQRRSSWGRTLGLLVERDLLDEEAVGAGRVSVRDLSRSNQVGLVCVDNLPRLVLKRAQLAVDLVDPHEAELAAYRWLASDPATAGLAPPLIYDGGDGVAVFGALAGARPFHALLAESEAPSTAAFEQLGTALGTLHAAAPEGLVERHPWVLHLPRRRVPAMLSGDAEVAALVDDIAGDDALAGMIDELRRAWGPLAPCHGDVKFDNVVGTAESDGATRVWLLDWEMAGLGLPAWDLAGVLDGLLLPALVCLTADEDLEAAFVLAEAAVPAVEAHRRVTGPLAPTEREIIVATVARLVQSAVQLLAMRHTEPTVTPTMARQVLAGAAALARRVAGNFVGAPSASG